jgi:hypothetical protein
LDLRPRLGVCVVREVEVDAPAAPLGMKVIRLSFDIVGDEMLAKPLAMLLVQLLGCVTLARRYFQQDVHIAGCVRCAAREAADQVGTLHLAFELDQWMCCDDLGDRLLGGQVDPCLSLPTGRVRHACSSLLTCEV